MRLTKFVVDLYLGSERGARLVAEFEALLGYDEPDDETAPDAEPSSLTAGECEPGSADETTQTSDDEEEEESDDDDVTSLVDDCFGPDAEAATRTLRELDAPVPETREAAHALYLDLLQRGVVIREKDVSAFMESAGEVEPSDSPEDPDEALVTVGGGDADGAREWLARIGGLSWALHGHAPEAFVPYAFSNQFDRFEAICSEFDIALARPPGLQDYVGRAEFYLAINDALQELREQLDLSPPEFDAFLYGFCCEQVTLDEVQELPSAQRAWLLLANPETDFDMLDQADLENREHWQGHYDVRPGDICVMWCRSPRSYVHSIWRATTRGFADPFFFYYRVIRIGWAVKVPPLKFRELQADATWAVKPATRAHFQNSSGKEISASEYQADAKTPAVIVSVAHLDDEERALVLGVLLEEVLTWVRSLPGTQRLRALVVFDEVYGFLPPHPANPPTKRPLVALMKQARAFGVGVVVATQNPMDLDYRALGNAGVWCVGRLQTDADCERVVDGLSAGPGGREEARALANVVKRLAPRWFVMRDAHAGGRLVLMQPRWAMSFLRGPMTRTELERAARAKGLDLPSPRSLRLVQGGARGAP